MFNRRVYYISGFDPRGSRFYHRLFREEAKKSEQVSGAKISTSKRKVLDDLITQWQVDSEWDGKSYKIDYRFMTWDDVMKQYWVSSIWILIFKSLPMYFHHIRIGLFPKFKKAGNGPYLFSLYPLAYCCLTLLVTTFVAFITFALTLLIFDQTIAAIAISSMLSCLLVIYSIDFGEGIGAWWVMQSYFFHARWIEQPLPDLEKRTQAFAERMIKDQLDSPVDEIIVVGHCTGAMVTVSVMAKLLSLQHERLKNKLFVMTLGQSIPYISYAAPAHHFRQSLEVFANNQHYPWFDMGARADPLCFQQVNPAIADGVTLTGEPNIHRALVRPYKMFSPEKYKELQKNKLRIHFQYLMAAEIKTDFDYFEIVTGHPNNIQSYKTPQS